MVDYFYVTFVKPLLTFSKFGMNTIIILAYIKRSRVPLRTEVKQRK